MNWREIKPITDITDFSQIELEHDWCNSTAQHLAEETDKFIFACFQQCGYSKDYILTHNHEFSITHFPNHRIFWHDDKKLFAIYEEPDFYDLTNPASVKETYYVTLRCEFY